MSELDKLNTGRRLQDVARFARFQLESKDIDPVYPILKWLQRDMDTEDALWHSLLYVTYYNLASMQTVWEGGGHKPGGIVGAYSKLPTGIERRNFRGGYGITKHSYEWAVIAKDFGLYQWLTSVLIPSEPRLNWQRLQKHLRQVWGNGRWAAYKTGEVLMKVNGLPLIPTDMGNDFSTGPRAGLALFFANVNGNDKAAIHRLDQQGEFLRTLLKDTYNVTLGIEELETVLCDFHSMWQGNYYAGHDIDLMQEQLLRQAHPSHGPLWKARLEVLPHKWLGEEHDWKGVDKVRKRIYRDFGTVIGR